MPNNPLNTDLNQILNSTQELLAEMQGEKIFITGGTGFFGCWLLETLIWANNAFDLNLSITILSRNPEAFKTKMPHLANNQTINYLGGDIENFTFPTAKFSYIIHAAANVTSNLQNQNQVDLQKIAIGTKRILDFATHCNAQKILLTSSGAVYGKQPSTIPNISEDYVINNESLENNTYAQGKLLAETMFNEYSLKYGLAAKIARCFAFVGPYLPLDTHFAIGNFILNGLRQENIIVKGDGTAYRSYMYAADLATWLLHILIKGKNCHPYNVGSEQAISINELANLVGSLFDHHPSILIEKQSSPPNQFAERYVPSTLRAQQELNLSINTTLEQAIAKTIEWHKQVTNQIL